MAKISKIAPQKEKASSSSSRPAGDKMLVEPLLHEIVPGPVVLKNDFKVENPSSVPSRCEHVSSGCLDASRGPRPRRLGSKLAATSSHAERGWSDLATCRWEAKNHGLGDVTELRSAPTGEEVVPKPAKDKKRRRASPSDTPKPKKSRARKPRGDFAALSIGVAQKAVVLHWEAFNKSQAELSRCEANLKKLNKERDALKCLYVKKEEEIRDLRADLAQARKKGAKLDTQVTIILKEIELLRWEVDQVKADCDWWKENVDRLAAEKEVVLAKLLSDKVQLRRVKEKSLAQAKRIEELEVELVEAKAEAGEMKISADKSIVVYLADAEAAQVQLREASDRERQSNDLVRFQSRREALEEIHARGYDLSKEIARAKALEADARLLLSSDDDDGDEANQYGSDNDDEPEEKQLLREIPAPGIHNLML
ncbi:uncharacterized protein [Nicotiana sylvestris]|uniref:uncharacterized protein n=1 Tax=Nicotiana sylvestris TaxID=4096 RepID=UPI00388CE36E